MEALITQTADQKINPSRELFVRQNRVQCERAFTFAATEKASANHILQAQRFERQCVA